MYIIGIAGGSGSGKTTFTHKVLNQVDDKRVGVLHQDSYYLASPPTDLKMNGELNFDHPDAFDWKLLSQHLELLKSGKKVETPTYDYKKFESWKGSLRFGTKTFASSWTLNAICMSSLTFASFADYFAT
jgi:uridine kinase